MPPGSLSFDPRLDATCLISSFACSALYDSLLACLALSLTQHVDSLRSNRRSAGCAAPLPLIPRHTALPVPYGSTTDRRRHRRALGSGAAHTHTLSHRWRERESPLARAPLRPHAGQRRHLAFSPRAHCPPPLSSLLSKHSTHANLSPKRVATLSKRSLPSLCTLRHQTTEV